MTIKAIVELRAHPGGRNEIVDLLNGITSSMPDVPGLIGLTLYEVPDEPDTIVEIVEWRTPEARARWIAQAAESGVLAPLVAALASPSRTTVVRLLDEAT